MHLAIRMFATASLLLTLAVNAASASQQGEELEAIILLPDGPRILPEFSFVNHRNEVFNKDNLRGGWSLMFFGYTHCPDVCPTTLVDIGRTYKAIDDESIRESIGVYFISVDPNRDNPEHLAQYIGYFNQAFTAATAEENELRKLATALGVTFKVEVQSESQTNYPVSHSGFTVLIDPDARFAGLYFPTPAQADAAARDLVRLVTGSQS